MSASRQLGELGEDRAVAWYVANGYQVLDRNWRSGRLGEIDIVLRRGNELVVSEVKTRSSQRFGMAAEAVTQTKQLRLRQLGIRYLAEHELGALQLRFDVVAIMGPNIEVITDAF